MNGVIDKANGDLLYAGTGDFREDGIFDEDLHEYRTDVPEPDFVRGDRDLSLMHRWVTPSWTTVAQPPRPAIRVASLAFASQSQALVPGPAKRIGRIALRPGTFTKKSGAFIRVIGIAEVVGGGTLDLTLLEVIAGAETSIGTLSISGDGEQDFTLKSTPVNLTQRNHYIVEAVLTGSATSGIVDGVLLSVLETG